MTGSMIFAVVLILMTIMAAIAIVAIATRRSDSEGAVTGAELDRRAAKADRKRRALQAEAAAEATDSGSDVLLVDAPAEYKDDAPRQDISETEYGVTRRKFFNRAIGAVFGLFMLQFTLASLAMFWPKLKGGFGTPINAGSAESLKNEVTDGASVVPKFVPAAQSWVVPFLMSELPGSSFVETPFVVAGGEGDGVGLMALWQRCVHLGCRVPSCESSQGFECPCHGSKYNRHGEYESGPAPRNLDRFGVSVDAGGQFIIDTGTIVQTSRAKNKTVAYPQGPFCVG
ncbi:MAG: ubiquinol-cytochrome c reductase iron-sulfur subunit [Acidimicrobiia bacterium]